MQKAKKEIEIAASKGYKGYPIATVAFYGEDENIATKVTMCIVAHEDAEADILGIWYSENNDIRENEDIFKEILQKYKQSKALSLGMTYSIIGCPHEEGIDYAIGSSCPLCTYWQDRERFIDKTIN